MRRIVIFSLSLLSDLLIGQSTICNQNLVPNPSFEDSLQCPTALSQIAKCRYWFSPNSGSPDYFNVCNTISGNGSVGIPINTWGSQTSHSGNAYTGIGSNVKGDMREYLSVKMTDSLTAGKKYCVSFFANLSEFSFAATNSLGIIMSDDSVFVPGFFLPLTSAYISDSLIIDSLNWVELKFNYNALGGEKYLIIGILRPDSLLTKIWVRNDSTSDLNYYYIDDVSVCNCNTQVDSIRPFLLYPNPASVNFLLSMIWVRITNLKFMICLDVL